MEDLEEMLTKKKEIHQCWISGSKTNARKFISISIKYDKIVKQKKWMFHSNIIIEFRAFLLKNRDFLVLGFLQRHPQNTLVDFQNDGELKSKLSLSWTVLGTKAWNWKSPECNILCFCFGEFRQRYSRKPDEIPMYGVYYCIMTKFDPFHRRLFCLPSSTSHKLSFQSATTVIEIIQNVGDSLLSSTLLTISSHWHHEITLQSFSWKINLSDGYT